MRKVIMIAGLVSFIAVVGQDYRPGQLWVLPMRYNVGLMGANWDINVVLNYRQQWKSISGGYTTYQFEGMVPIFADGGNKLDVGISAIQDIAGAFKTIDGRLGVSYTRFMNNVGISVGVLGGYIDRRIDGNNLMWGDQYVKGLFVSTQSTEEVIDVQRLGLPRVGAGINIFSSSTKGGGSIGIFVDNLNGAKDGYISGSSILSRYKYSGHLFLKVGFGRGNSYIGGGIYGWYEGGIVEDGYGIQVRYNELSEGDISLFGSMWYRRNSAMIFGLGGGYRWVRLYYSYELPFGPLAASFATLPVHEVSLQVVIDRGLRREEAVPMF